MNNININSENLPLQFKLLLSIFQIFFTFTGYKKTNNVSIYKIISAVFCLGIILDRLLKNCAKLYINIGLALLPV